MHTLAKFFLVLILLIGAQTTAAEETPSLRGDPAAIADAMERAPYTPYRLAGAIARGDSDLEVRYGAIDGIPGPPALEFVGPDDVAHGWILLNVRKEPIIWATTQSTGSVIVCIPC